MEAAIVPCGFAILYLWQSRNRMDARVADTLIHTMAFAAVVAAIPWPSVSWSLVMPPLVIFLFFVVYQRARAGRPEPPIVYASI